MKDEITATLRIPTAQQYAYIEITLTGTPDMIIQQYLSFTRLYKKMQKQEDSVPF